MFDPKVVQARCNHHDQIRKTVFGVSQNLLADPRTLDAGEGMFHFDTDFGQLAIAMLVFGRQFFLTWLFFGRHSFRTFGS